LIIAQKLATAGMAQLAERLCFDLTDALSRNVEMSADILKRVGYAVREAKAHANDLLFTGREGAKHLCDLLSQLPKNEVRRIRRMFFSHTALRKDSRHR